MKLVIKPSCRKGDEPARRKHGNDIRERSSRDAHSHHCLTAESTGTVARFPASGAHQAMHAAPCCGPSREASVTTAQHGPAVLGAKLGAILCGRLWTGVDAGGIESPYFRTVWTAVDGCGRCL
jgi:hypothetical protein